MKNVAFLGLGAMGSRMARHLLDLEGHTLTVYNRSPERAAALVEAGAKLAPTPRAAVAEADVVISVLTDDEASRAVWLHPEHGARGGLRAGALAIEASTITPAWVENLAAALTADGVRFVDAPVVGSRPQAEAGGLVFLMGGAAPDVEAAQAVVAPLAKVCHHVGPVTAGAKMKLAVNGYFGVQVAALAELLGALSQQGITPAQAMKVFGGLPITSPALAGLGGAMVADQHAPLFPVALVAKDFRYAVGVAESADAPTPVLRATRDAFAAADEAGYGDLNIGGIARLYLGA